MAGGYSPNFVRARSYLNLPLAESLPAMQRGAAGVSPSPPLEERVGERKPFVHDAVPEQEAVSSGTPDGSEG